MQKAAIWNAFQYTLFEAPLQSVQSRKDMLENRQAVQIKLQVTNQLFNPLSFDHLFYIYFLDANIDRRNLLFKPGSAAD